MVRNLKSSDNNLYIERRCRVVSTKSLKLGNKRFLPHPLEFVIHCHSLILSFAV
jgi:hypothetical protein